MRPRFKLGVVLLVLGLGIGGRAAALDVQATLIHASDASVAQDRRLEFVEYRLRRVFPFKSYAWVGQGNVTFAGNEGEATLDLGLGMTASIRTRARNGRVAAQVRWMKGNQVLLGTEVVTAPRTPSVLGGIPHGEGTLILVLMFR